ncbi:MAG: alpha/beta fold hydrolase, partial [Iamia sp.]
MTDPQTPDHLLTLPDGRRLAIDERGPADGPVVVFLHSSPGSRCLDPEPAATAAAGVRLVTIDRPGYGASSPWPDGVVPTLAGCADDVTAALDHLGAAEAAVAGWSAGGRVAAGVAARHPDRVRALALIATPSPADSSWIPPEHQAMLEPLRDDPATATARMVEILASFLDGDPADAIAINTGEADQPVLADPAVRDRMVAMFTEAFRSGPHGVAADIVADQIADWGYDPAAIGGAAQLFSRERELLPPPPGEWWGD